MTNEHLSAGQCYRIAYDVRENTRRLRERGTQVGENSQVWGYVDWVFPDKVRIGRNVVISGSAAILTHGLDATLRGGDAVVIGDNVFVGYGATILPGVTIGDGAVVGAGAVVTKDVEPRAVVAGNPARFLRWRDECELSAYIQRRESGEWL